MSNKPPTIPARQTTITIKHISLYQKFKHKLIKLLTLTIILMTSKTKTTVTLNQMRCVRRMKTWMWRSCWNMKKTLRLCSSPMNQVNSDVHLVHMKTLNQSLYVVHRAMCKLFHLNNNNNKKSNTSLQKKKRKKKETNKTNMPRKMKNK